MGASLSREGAIDEYDSSDQDEEEEEEEEEVDEEEQKNKEKKDGAQIGLPSSSSSSSRDSLGLKVAPAVISPRIKQAAAAVAKLYHYERGSTAKMQWIPVRKSVPWRFTRSAEDSELEGEEEDENEGFLRKESGVPKGFKQWFLVVDEGKIRTCVNLDLQMKFFEEQRRADFVKDSVWSLKFPTPDIFFRFMTEYHSCLFENTHFLEATTGNKIKVFGKDFTGWANPEESDDTLWEDVSEYFETPAIDEKRKKLREAYSEASLSGGIQSLTLGAGGNSFLIGGSGIEAFQNTPEGLCGKGMTISFSDSVTSSPSYGSLVTPKKGILTRGESNMMVLSPVGEAHARGVHQLDLDVGKVVTEWRFEKDGTPITMRDVSNESKGAQLDPSSATFLGLDDNRLCRWDTRDRHGIVQELDTSDPPSLNWSGGHQFARGTDFQCFATTGDGSIAVGSKDGKIRLYSTTSMRVAKTAFPSLGSPITSIDVTFDGNWVLATADTHLILISTVFRDKDGRMKTGFSGRMGNKIAAPRLLRLTPLDAHLAGKNYKFSGGRFSWITESGRQERYLVATVGKFTVIWNFRRVKESKHECFRQTQGLKSCYCYRIVPKEESIVDSRFMHDNYMSNSPEAPLVVATPMNVSSFNAWNDD